MTYAPARDASDAVSTTHDVTHGSNANFDVVSLLREHPSQTDQSNYKKSDVKTLDFGTTEQLYGSDSVNAAGHKHVSENNGENTHGKSDRLKDNSSVPVQLIDASDEIHRAEKAYKQGDPDRAKEWLQDADQNLKELSKSSNGDSASTAGGDSHSNGSSNSSSSDSHSCDSSNSSSSDSHSCDSSNSSSSDSHPSDSPSASAGDSKSGGSSGDSSSQTEPQTPLQQIESTLSQAFQALASGDMQQFQALLSQLVTEVEQLVQGGSSNGSGSGADGSVPSVAGSGAGDGQPTAGSDQPPSSSTAGGDQPPASGSTPGGTDGSTPGQNGGVSWVYHDGKFNWPGDWSFGAKPNYENTSGSPLSGSTDIKVNLSESYGGFQPYGPNRSFDTTGSNYLTFALKPDTANNTDFHVGFERAGDTPVGKVVQISDYGPTPEPGKWGIYNIPLSALGVENMNIYKFMIQDNSGTAGSSFLLDNVGFSENPQAT